MAFRSLVINNRCKLNYSLNYLIITKDEEVKKILLDEVRIIIINSTQVSITTALISECLDKKIKICFSDAQHNLCGELTPYKNNYYSNRRLKEQLEFTDDSKGFLWQQIIKRKITNQRNNIDESKDKKAYDILSSYIDDVQAGDITNREGLAAKLYFRSIFGDEFNRKDDSIKENKYLNYGYSIILSAINRTIKTLGYYTELGIHHAGESNTFNLSCDFMEPLRPLIDKVALEEDINDENFKTKMISLLTKEVNYSGRTVVLDNAIEEYVEDLLSFLRDGDQSKINFIEYEL